MEDVSIHLLSKNKLNGLFFALREAEKEFAKYFDQFMLMSKYHQRLWFQKVWFMTEQELIIEMRIIGMKCDRLEAAINEYKTLIYLHNSAVEELHKTNKPFDIINISHHTLTQQQLFT